MTNLPASGAAQRTSSAQAGPLKVDVRKSKGFSVTLLLLVIAGIASLIIAEQVATGWLALGERANISRRDINPIELFVIIGSTLWGVICLWTASGFLFRRDVVSMDTYFRDRHSRMAPGVLLTITLLGVIGLLSLLISEQVATGWIALGERVNISRRDINWLEWSVIILGIVWGLISLRTVYGLWTHDRRAWSWAQWVTLITAMLGMGLLTSGITDLRTIIPTRGGSILDNLPGVQELTAPGLLIFLSAVVSYRFLAIDTETSAAQAIRNQLGSVPGAGAIVGVIVIASFFAISSDLFLEQRSIANILTNNITRGIVAIGITFLMISGEFDLSVGSVFGAGALVFLLMMTEGIAIAALIGVPLIVIGLTLIVYGRAGKPQLALIGLAMIIAGFAAPFIVRDVLITSVIPAVLIALAFAALLGYVNGFILITTGIPSFIVTLGTLLAYRAILLVVVADGRILRYADYRLPPPWVYIDHRLIAAGAVVLAVLVAIMGRRLILSSWKSLRARLANYRSEQSDFRDFFLFLTFVRLVVSVITVGGAIVLLAAAAVDQFQASTTQTLLEISFFDIANGRFGFVTADVNLRSGVMWWLILVVVFQFILTQTRYGNHVFAVGGNPGAARAQGISVNRVKVTNFIICSVLAATAGIINVARLANVDPLTGNGLELEVIAASVIGGALLTGGYGSIIGALLGVLIFGMLQTGLVLIGVDARAFSGVIGIIIIVAVVINTVVRRVRT
ncbi:hypothetical protein FBR02_04040 [Anaerolineae bacterium CFX9]|nr:hypothetical protein [Anaerolineae bacterium CFX9]